MDKYRVVIRYIADKETYVARAPEIPGCEVEAESRAEAIASLEKELEAQLANIEEQGAELPVPIDEQDFDGQLSLKLTPELHRELVFLATESQVELDVLLTELLARGVQDRQRQQHRGPRGRAGGQQSSGRPSGEGGRGRRGGPSGQRYHDIMENRAEFMEYVRSLEGGGGGGGGGGRSGRRGRKPRG